MDDVQYFLVEYVLGGNGTSLYDLWHPCRTRNFVLASLQLIVELDLTAAQIFPTFPHRRL